MQSIQFLNGKAQSNTSVTLNETDRATRYGDGFFISGVMFNGRLLLKNYHAKKFSEAIKTFFLQPEIGFDEHLRLAENLYLQGYHRFRLLCFRKAGGMYAPEDDAAHCLLQITEHPGFTIQHLGKPEKADSVFNVHTSYSRFKTLSSIKYVLAGKEMKQRGLDEIIICDNRGYVSEGLSSNLFWWNGETLFTPSVDSGCVEGTMRNALMDYFIASSTKVQECLIEEIPDGAVLFRANANGIAFLENGTDEETQSAFEGRLQAFLQYIISV